ncbi:GNAT family N-acetyltransferase, partial [Chloroflexota bacterium]
MAEFRLNDYERLTDGEIKLVIKEKRPADEKRGYVSAYQFDILLPGQSKPAGRIDLRIGNTDYLITYSGHIGYGIGEEYRGNHYAAKACNLVKQVALGHGMKTLWITCDTDNYPSRKTC